VDHAGISIYHPVKLDRDYLVGKALDRFGMKHTVSWQNSSAIQKIWVQEEFRDLVTSLEESLAIDNPAIFIDHARWAKVHLTYQQFPDNHVSLLLVALGEVLKNELPLDFRGKSVTFIKESLVILKKTSTKIPSFISGDNPIADVARSFLDALIAGDQERAGRLLADVGRSGTPLEEIYLYIFQPVLQETGRLWQLQQINIAHEHFVTAFIELLMAKLHGMSLSSVRGEKKRRGTTVVAVGVGAELHDVGIHMVANFFEMDGWDVYYTGANMPVNSILEVARDRKADMIALSTTMPRNLRDVHYLIRSLHSDERTTKAKIIVGGYPYKIVPDLWKQIGADAYAETATEAVSIADRLVPERG
jgi:methanogenic corrinoid protein MtbC1